jgi:hypothetical protein
MRVQLALYGICKHEHVNSKKKGLHTGSPFNIAESIISSCQTSRNAF